VIDLARIDKDIWPGLAHDLRFPLTLANVRSYVAEYGVDGDLAVGLLADPRITETEAGLEAEAVDLAVKILAARDPLSDPGVRVRIAQSLRLDGPIEVTRLNWERGELAGLLVKAGIVDDDAAVYQAILGTDWETREFLISKSARFAEYVTPELLPPEDLKLLLGSKAIGDAVKRRMVEQIKRFTRPVNSRTLQTAADYALQKHVPLDAETLLLFAEAKVTASTIAPLLQVLLPDIPLESLLAILTEMGNDYAVLVGPSHRSVKLPNDSAHRALAARLQAIGDVSSFEEARDGKIIKVNMRHR
jgi:hypothetical protein